MVYPGCGWVGGRGGAVVQDTLDEDLKTQQAAGIKTIGVQRPGTMPTGCGALNRRRAAGT